MKYNKILIDASNFYIRAYYAGKIYEVETDKGKIAISGILRAFDMMKSIKNKYLANDGTIIFIFDNCSSGVARRRNIDPDYKINRSKKDDAFYRVIDIFHQILISYDYGLKCVQCTGYEADDLVQPICNKYPDDNILLVSNDMDWARSITDKVHLAKYENNKRYEIYDPNTFYSKFGFTPNERSIIMYKSFRGDASDNISPGVPNIKEETLKIIVRDFKTIEDLVERLDNVKFISPIFKKRIQENVNKLKLNEKLVSFLPIKDEDLKSGIQDCKYSCNLLNMIYKSLKIDIYKFDPRVYRDTMNLCNIDEENFFQFDTIERK